MYMLALLFREFVSCEPAISKGLRQGRVEISTDLHAFRACGSRHAVGQGATFSDQGRDVSVNNMTCEGMDIYK